MNFPRLIKPLFFILTYMMLGATPLANPKAVSGFPLTLSEANTSRGLVAADLDGNGRMDVIVVHGQGLSVVDGSGATRIGFPISLRHPEDKGVVKIAGAPAVCDFTGDGRKEIIVGDEARRVYVISHTGTVLSGFPIRVGGVPKASFACLPNGRGHDILFTTDDGVLMQLGAGQARARALVKIGKGAESGVAIADISGNGQAELITVGGDSRLYVVDLRGKPLAGFDYRMAFRASGTPAVGDINDDGKPNIVVASQDFKIHAVDNQGSSLPGFPVPTDYRIYAGVSLGDLTGNGVLDIVVGSGDSKVYAVNGSGKSLPGFPVKLDGRIIADTALADFTKEGKQSIAVVTQKGSLYVLNNQGKRLAGFPVRIGGKNELAPLAVDFAGEGVVSLLAQNPTGALSAYQLPQKNKAKKALIAWGMVGHDAANSGRFGPNEGRFKDLRFKVAEPTTTDALEVAYRFFDLDGDKEGSTQIRWFKEGKLQSGLNNQRSVPPSLTKKHETWNYTLQADENFTAYGEDGVLVKIFASAQVKVRNTPPTLPKIALTPEIPYTTTALNVAVTEPSTDPDGDTIEYRFIWLQDGAPRSYPQTQTTVVPLDTRKNQEWRVVVVPYDGEVEGASATLAVIIKNTPPQAPHIAVAPTAPGINDVVQVSISKPAPDVDRDPITYEYRYWVNDTPLLLGRASSSIQAKTLRKHQRVRVEVTAVDDEEPGGKVEAFFVVQNTPPAPPNIAIWPSQPKTADGLRLGVLSQPEDADADTVVLRHRWFRDGAEVALPTTVSPAETKKGQRWRLEVTPFDGEIAGKAVSVESVIENTPPTSPVVSLPGYEFFTDQVIEPRIDAPSEDADGDAIRLKYRWLRSGEMQKFAESKASLLAAETRKGQIWTVKITPHDGTADGIARSLQFAIKNSPPTAPTLRLTHHRPTTAEAVSVAVATPATDKDNDKLTYRYRWFRNGSLVADWPLTQATVQPNIMKKGENWRVEVRAFDGEDEGALALAELTVQNHAPTAFPVALAPASPKTTDDIECTTAKAAIDPDGDALVYRYEWQLDGAPVTLSPDLRTLPKSYTKKGQKWSCHVQAFDGELLSAQVNAAPVVIQNSAPSVPEVVISPKVASTTDDLFCELAKPSSDADYDLVRYTYEWQVNGKAQKAPKAEEPHRIPASLTRRGQAWSCSVVPSDGTANGPAGTAQVTIQNSQPTAPRVQITPRRPSPGAAIQCEIVEDSRDADGDKVSYAFRWLKDGVPQSFASTSTEVPGRLVKPRDVWKCQVTPSDGAASGAKAESADVLVEAKR